MTTPTPLPDFLSRWQSAGGAERANYQSFLIELCDLLQVPRPDPTTPDDAKNNYVFDRSITTTKPDGTTAPNFIDLYKRAHFVLETKQGIENQSGIGIPPMSPRIPATKKTKPLKKGHGPRNSPLWNDALLRAKSQAESYVRNIPDDNPPFLLVVDVGYSIETYSDFSGLGKTYTPFPDNLSHRFKLTDLADPIRGPELLDRLQKIWTDPQSLNPAKRSAKVTRKIAAALAELSKSLEKSGHHPEHVAHFLMRVLFTLFAEDVHLIPNNAFTNLLESLKETPEKFAPMAMAVWQNMDKGGFSPVLREDLLRFNGGLFSDTQALKLTGNQLELLIDAAHQDWSDVEPAIFGTLLERALNPTERHKLGAHYTPRAYVERLVLPTVIEPLREEWTAAQDKAASLAKRGDKKKAIKTVEAFLHTLCHTTVLDPACGSGNFLYVTLEHMKRLEGEVQDFLKQLDSSYQFPLALPGQTVHPQQLHGIEINPRAAAIADLVIWIGYLQWHFRTHGHTMPTEPVLQKIDNIENRDAVLEYDKKELARDDHGKPLSRWDGTTFKKHPVTGEDVPDDSVRAPIFSYTNPSKADWPKADYVVGNPPFIGNKRMRLALSGEYVEALRIAVPEVPETADFVMYWWDQAARLLRAGKLKRFGLITTNSITQFFNQQVLKYHLFENPPIALAFAIPDHPWVETADGAAVRIAMTVGSTERERGVLATVKSETQNADGDFDVQIVTTIGVIHQDLTVGVDVRNVQPLQSNKNICLQGCKLVGAGFIITPEQRNSLIAAQASATPFLPRYITGSDIVKMAVERYVIDFHGHTAEEARRLFPAGYQILLDKVKPERDQNRRETRKNNWWLFGENAPKLRRAVKGLQRFIATSEVSKHRAFVFLPLPISLADGSLAAIAHDDAFVLGILSARICVTWALATGGSLGPTPRFQNGPCFDPFPFPDCSEKQKARIRKIAEELDAHRKRQQAKFPDLTLTDMYNILEKLRAADRGEISAAQFSPKDKTIHDHGLISILKQLHDELDAAVFDAYGWPTTLTNDQLLEKLVALNHERATAEEKRGIIKYLRPNFQNPSP